MKFNLIIYPLCILLSASTNMTHAQSDSTKTTSSPFSIEGYVDAYFSFDFNEPENSVRPYFVSYSRHNEFNINLAYLSVKYIDEKVRAVFTPGFGTYVNANYAAERMTLKNIIEANVGIKLSRRKNIWLDAGVLPSPYTNENAIAFDQINYTRSIAPEYVPYYLTGVRLSLPVSKKINLYSYILNGWQQIEDVNSPLSLGTSLEYKPNATSTLTWNTYVGNEHSAVTPSYEMRYFSDLYIIMNTGKKWSFSACIYGGLQEVNTPSEKVYNKWYQGNVALKYSYNSKSSISGRVEYFNDANMVMIAPITGVQGFNAFSGTIGYNLNVAPQVLFRIEGRQFISAHDIYIKDNNSTKYNTVITAGITARFK